MYGSGLSVKIDVCPCWDYQSSDSQICLASSEFCDIDVASAWAMCPVFKKFLEIFEEVLDVKEVVYENVRTSKK